MKKDLRYTLITLTLIIGFVSPASVFAGMGSQHFHLTTSVFSGGGTAMESDHFKMTATLGQPSPLMVSEDPPISENFSLEPGFWYTLEAIFIKPCEGDFGGDGDVDGSDLAVFANDFGRTDCP